MKKNSVGKQLRNYIATLNKINLTCNPYAMSLKGRSDYPDVVSYVSFCAICANAENTNFDKESMDAISVYQRSIYVHSSMVVLQIFVDTYKILNLREKMDIINALDEALLKKMRECKDISDIISVLRNETNISLIAEAARFSDEPVYDKVLQMKALEESDVEFLMGLFPIFEEEYNNYNVEVNEAFMARQIRKWPGQFNGDVEKAYEDAAHFLDQYSILNNSLYERIAEQTNHEVTDDTEAMLRKFIIL